MTKATLSTWAEVKNLALALDLRKVEIAVSWGNENLKAHGKMWTWWSPYIEVAIFKGSRDERDTRWRPTRTIPHTDFSDSAASHGLGGPCYLRQPSVSSVAPFGAYSAAIQPSYPLASIASKSAAKSTSPVPGAVLSGASPI